MSCFCCQPSHDFLLALFNLVREKSLLGFIPELMQLTLKVFWNTCFTCSKLVGSVFLYVCARYYCGCVLTDGQCRPGAEFGQPRLCKKQQSRIPAHSQSSLTCFSVSSRISLTSHTETHYSKSHDFYYI